MLFTLSKNSDPIGLNLPIVQCRMMSFREVELNFLSITQYNSYVIIIPTIKTSQHLIRNSNKTHQRTMKKRERGRDATNEKGGDHLSNQNKRSVSSCWSIPCYPILRISLDGCAQNVAKNEITNFSVTLHLEYEHTAQKGT